MLKNCLVSCRKITSISPHTSNRVPKPKRRIKVAFSRRKNVEIERNRKVQRKVYEVDLTGCSYRIYGRREGNQG